MKIKNLIEVLQSIDPELELFKESSFQDMQASISAVSTEVRPVVHESGYVELKWSKTIYGTTIAKILALRELTEIEDQDGFYTKRK